VKHATGRGSQFKYSTSMDWDEWKKKRRKYPVEYSTAEDSKIYHSTGREVDKKVRLKLLEEEMKKREQESKKEGNKKIHLKPLKKIIIDY